MSRILVIAEHDGRAAERGPPHAAPPAPRAIGGEITIAVLGQGIGAIAQDAAALDGVTRVLTFDNAPMRIPAGRDFWRRSWRRSPRDYTPCARAFHHLRQGPAAAPGCAARCARHSAM